MQDLDSNALPDDPDSLKALLIDQATQFAAQLKDKEQQLSVYETELRYLREQIRLLLHKRFAASSEKQKYPGQHELFDEAETEADIQQTDADAAGTALTDAAITVTSHDRKKPGRKPLPADLPRVEVIHDLPEAEQFCSEDGHRLHRIGEDVSEQLEIIPAQVRVIRNIRYKYACRHCETGIKAAAVPQVIPRSIATAGLLAFVAVSKYADALPLHRQSKIFRRIGVELNRRTLADWMIQMAAVLGPLMDLLRTELLSSRVLHMDETRVQVLQEPGRSADSQSQMWVAVSGGYDPPAVVYHYDPSRSAAVPEQLLANYQGYLVIDGYAGYNRVSARPDIISIGCWAHARRKFDEAIEAQGKSARPGRARYAVNEIGKLYAIETVIKDKHPEDKYVIRQARAKPIITRLRNWLDKTLPQVPPKTALGKALHYLDGQWPRLIRYLDNGELPIDNNRCENAIRPFVTGRKNWLFSNSQQGARASATIYSLIESAKLNGLEPYRYLRFVLTAVANGPDDLTRLLPHNLDAATIEC